MIWRSERIGSAVVSIVDDDVSGQLPASVPAALGVDRVALVRQVHGADVAWSDQLVGPDVEADAICLRERGVAALVRVADCTPIALVDPDRPLAAVVHAGRAGLVAGVVAAAVDELRGAGAGRLVAVVGPRVCGRCYELSAELADAVAAAVPAARATTAWGTPAADVGAGVVAQLLELDVEVRDLGAAECTMEHDRWFSYRRQGAAAGRFAIAAVLT